jgi:Ca2+-binding RTX toxin-like protein
VKRIVLLLTAGALFLTMMPTVAFAAEVKCGGSGDRSSDPVICTGTNNNDVILERNGTNQDEIRALGGSDTIRADLSGGDRDYINAGTGGDTIFTNDRDTRDEIHCGDGNDTATIDVVYDESGDITAADKVYNCETVKAKDQNGTIDEIDQSTLPQNQ